MTHCVVVVVVVVEKWNYWVTKYHSFHFKCHLFVGPLDYAIYRASWVLHRIYSTLSK